METTDHEEVFSQEMVFAFACRRHIAGSLDAAIFAARRQSAGAESDRVGGLVSHGLVFGKPTPLEHFTSTLACYLGGVRQLWPPTGVGLDG